MKNVATKDGNVVKRKSRFLAISIICVSVALVVFLVSFFLVKSINNSKNANPSVRKLYSLWQNGEYQQLYEDSASLIEKKSVNVSAFILHGYSAYFLALADTDITNSQSYLDEAIYNLRYALYHVSDKMLPQLYYMLGKVYFQKNVLSAYYYYSDLVVKYLKLATDLGYSAPDIPEYLGICYADLGKDTESIMEFTRALKNRKSDMLLYSIANQYCKVGQSDNALPYLTQIIQESEDDEFIQKSQILLADIYFSKGDYQAAQQTYEAVLEKNPNSVDALYGMGNIYEKKGDMAKARSEWRKVLKFQVDHSSAKKKLGI